MTNCTPSPLTRAALLAVLKMDDTITPAHRARILAVFDDPGASADERPVGWVNAAAAAQEAGVTLPRLLRWCEAGKVQSRRAGGRRTLVDPGAVKAYAASHPDGRTRKPE